MKFTPSRIPLTTYTNLILLCFNAYSTHSHRTPFFVLSSHHWQDHTNWLATWSRRFQLHQWQFNLLATPRPYIHLGFDQLMQSRRIFVQWTTLDHIVSLDCVAHMGWPLWVIHISAFSSSSYFPDGEHVMTMAMRKSVGPYSATCRYVIYPPMNCNPLTTQSKPFRKKKRNVRYTWSGSRFLQDLRDLCLWISPTLPEEGKDDHKEASNLQTAKSIEPSPFVFVPSLESDLTFVLLLALLLYLAVYFVVL